MSRRNSGEPNPNREVGNRALSLKGNVSFESMRYLEDILFADSACIQN